VKCPSPVWIQDKTSGGCMYVPCGKCTACRISHASAWTIRLLHEARNWQDRCFVTLTYDDEHLPKNKSLDKRAIQLFFKKLRKNFETKIKYFAAGEYGEQNSRPHYHLILYGVSSSSRHIIELCWPFGFISVGDFSFQRARYVAGYAVKKLYNGNADYYKIRGMIPEFSLSSRNPAIGKNYMEEHAPTLRREGLVRVQGKTYPLPRYYKNKIYSEDDKVLVRALAQDFYDEAKTDLCIKSQGLIDISLEEFIKAENIQHNKNLNAKLSRRKL